MATELDPAIEEYVRQRWHDDPAAMQGEIDKARELLDILEALKES